jgi:hypothetical protein
VGILGDLHIDPRKMEDYETGREHWLPIFEEAKNEHGNVALVSLGDLGESKNCGHNPSNPSELFAGYVFFNFALYSVRTIFLAS